MRRLFDMFDRAYLTVLGLILAVGCTSGVASAEKFTQDKHLLFIDGVISGSTMGPVQQALEQAVTSGYTGTVTIVLDSPGGEVLAGMRFVNTMIAARSAGIRLDCYVLNMAASMAFQILTQCTNRHVLDGSFLLWHSVRVGIRGYLTPAVARAVADDLERMNFLIMQQLRESLRDMKDSDIQKAFDQETFWSGAELSERARFASSSKAHAGLMRRLIRAVRTEEENPFAFLFGGEGGGAMEPQYIYMYEPSARQ